MFCVTLGVKIASTATISNDLQPKWHEQFFFNVCHDNVEDLSFGTVLLQLNLRAVRSTFVYLSHSHAQHTIIVSVPDG